MAGRPLRTVDDRVLNGEFWIPLFSNPNIRYAVRDRETNQFIPILKQGERLTKNGKLLKIQPTNETASLRMRDMMKERSGRRIRWLDELYIITPQGRIIRVKKYIEGEYGIRWFS